MNDSNTEDNKIFLEIDLLGNAIDFILKGIDELFDENSVLRAYINPKELEFGNFKYGILHLYSGFLLLLKEKLYRHLPESIFMGKISDARKKLRDNKTPNTVDLDEALERLEFGPRFVFDESQLEIIRAVQGFRNQFEHYKVRANRYQLWKVVEKFLSIIDIFMVNELNINIEVYSVDNFSLREKLNQIGSVYQRVMEQMEREEIEELKSKLASFLENREDALRALDADSYEEGGIETFIECPECGDETLITFGEYRGLCSNPECESVHPIAECDRCSQTMVGFSWEFNLCENCIADIERE